MKHELQTLLNIRKLRVERILRQVSIAERLLAKKRYSTEIAHRKLLDDYSQYNSRLADIYQRIVGRTALIEKFSEIDWHIRQLKSEHERLYEDYQMAKNMQSQAELSLKNHRQDYLRALRSLEKCSILVALKHRKERVAQDIKEETEAEDDFALREMIV